MATLGIQITPTGPVIPSYADVLAQLQNAFYSIYGSDCILTPQTQDGQWLAVLAQAITDCNNGAVAVYNSFSPASAQGAGLSSVVKINGLARLVPSSSQVVVSVTGQVGTIITNGIVGDNLNLGTQWALPATVTIPIAGVIAVTATCTTAGATAAGVGTITKILTPTLGWQSVTNTSAASPGALVETDPALRQRQAASVSLPAQTVLEAIAANVASVTGVNRSHVYENDTDAADGNGLPPHSIAAVVEGGSALAIATAIAVKKSTGTTTYGTTSEVIIDQNGVPDTINFYVLSDVIVTVDITISPLAGYVSTTGAYIQAAVAAFIEALPIGQLSYLNRLFAPANLMGDAATGATGLTQAQLDVLSATYTVTAITQSRASDAPPAVQDVPIAFNEAAICSVANVNLTT